VAILWPFTAALPLTILMNPSQAIGFTEVSNNID